MKLCHFICGLFQFCGLLSTSPQSQINSEERETPPQSSKALAMNSILDKSQFDQRRKQLLSQLPQQDIFLHLRQISLWIDPLDATQEFSGGH